MIHAASRQWQLSVFALFCTGHYCTRSVSWITFTSWLLELAKWIIDDSYLVLNAPSLFSISKGINFSTSCL